MAGQKRDDKWLKDQLSPVLKSSGWDDMIIESLLDTVVRTAAPGGNREELDELVQNFLADNPRGIAVIEEFLSASSAPSSGPGSAAARSGAGGSGGSGGSGSAGAGWGGNSSGAATAKSYAASASASGAGGSSSSRAGGSSSSAPRQTHSQQHQQQHRQQQQHQHQQQAQAQAQGRGQRQQAHGSESGPGAGPASGWQALGSGSAASAGTKGGGGGGGGGDGDGDDFSRFVVDDRGPGGSGKGGGSGSRSKQGSSRDLQALDASAAGAEKPSGAAGDPGKVLGMFKAGGRIRAPAAKPVGMRMPDGGALALAKSLERKVINCLGCGKIYDCRNVTNDVLRFLEKGGVCTFCGDVVPLLYKNHQKAATEAASASGAEGAREAGPDGGGARDQSAPGPGAGGEDAATAAARAFKDRLVEYDRNAAKRTTVIDDQSDFFEIDTNAWLTDQEREELRRRRQLEEEAEANRRKRLTVTFDLIGRKVVLDEDVRKAEAAAAAAAAEQAAAAKKAAAAAEALRNTDGDGGSTYGNSVAFSGNALGGGMAAGGPTSEQLAAALDSLRRMKASLNPAVATTSAPLFLPSTHTGTGSAGAAGAASAKAAASANGAAAGSGKGGGGSAAGAAAGAGSGGASRRHGPAVAGQRGGKGADRPAGRQARRDRVQHDLGTEFGFDAFGAEVALDELYGGALLGAGAADEQSGPYDICPPDMAPSTSYATTAAASAASSQSPRSVPGLPPGVVLLKGFLSLDEQIRIVQQIRDLGIGPGGFYVPSYGTGARLSLHMMCLGLHWEPRTSKYEATRSSYDGATPPPIPPWLVELCDRCLASASATSAAAPGGARFPSLKPDICLANFYERSGKLGMHQDKDELPESLRAGLPVVSLSLGDAADFLYGRTREVENAEGVRLESGDLLVFGGPGRMIFHSVTKVHPNTAPPELIRATGLRPGRLNLTFRQYGTAAPQARPKQ